jgi:predicted AlkP superfamily pyrophosphatase or phosphodiesterase
MKRLIVLSVIASICLFTANAKKNTRIVMIALDGISVNGFQQAKTPHLDALLAEGALSLTTRVVMPSITLPNWTSILTGSSPEQHGVVDNSWELNKFTLPPTERDADGYYPSVFTVLKNKVPNVKTAFYYNWVNLFYPHNPKYFDEVEFLEDDGYIPNYDKAFDFIVKNRNYPTIVYLYSVHTDHMGHVHGWMSPEYIKSIEEADEQIGLLIEKMKKEGLYESTYFMFLSDHGGIKKGHGGFSVDEMEVPWGIVGPGIKKGYKIEQPNNTMNTASLILHLFKVPQPASWSGHLPKFIFK